MYGYWFKGVPGNWRTRRISLFPAERKEKGSNSRASPGRAGEVLDVSSVVIREVAGLFSKITPIRKDLEHFLDSRAEETLE